MYRVGILGCDDFSLFAGMVLVLDLCIWIYMFDHNDRLCMYKFANV